MGVEVQGGVALWERERSKRHDLLALHTPATARHELHVETQHPRVHEALSWLLCLNGLGLDVQLPFIGEQCKGTVDQEYTFCTRAAIILSLLGGVKNNLPILPSL